MSSLFPMFVKLAGRKCVVVGGGAAAEAKLEELLLSEAEVVVIAPAVTRRIEDWSIEVRLSWHAREFEVLDLDGAFLVIAATGIDSVSQSVFQEAEKRGVLCNAIDEPDRCHFYYPAVVRRGQLQIAISAGGQSPSLHRLRIELEQQFGPELGPWIKWLGTARRLLQKKADKVRRIQLLRRLASRQSFDRFVHRQKGRTGGSV
jgi:precorrin-2 dehydrogenase / sirohydrochlorin ferrochelatase